MVVADRVERRGPDLAQRGPGAHSKHRREGHGIVDGRFVVPGHGHMGAYPDRAVARRLGRPVDDHVG
jgi:hypothetical protein